MVVKGRLQCTVKHQSYGHPVVQYLPVYVANFVFRSPYVSCLFSTQFVYKAGEEQEFHCIIVVQDIVVYAVVKVFPVASVNCKSPLCIQS